MYRFLSRLLSPLTETQEYARDNNFELVHGYDEWYLIYDGDLVGNFGTEFLARQFINSTKFA
jgi:hypothetical protein